MSEKSESTLNERLRAVGNTLLPAAQTKREAPDTDILMKLVAKKFAELDDRCAHNERERLRAVGNTLLPAAETKHEAQGLTASQIGKCHLLIKDPCVAQVQSRTGTPQRTRFC